MEHSDKVQTAPGRFDRLFALCEQELRQSRPKRSPKPRDSQRDAQACEAFRKAAIQSLLQRPTC